MATTLGKENEVQKQNYMIAPTNWGASYTLHSSSAEKILNTTKK